MAGVTNHIQGTISLPLILSINKSDNIKCYFYAEFAVHKYMRGHTSGFMTMGTGGSYLQSIEKILNKNSSTEAELVRVYGVLTKVIWNQ